MIRRVAKVATGGDRKEPGVRRGTGAGEKRVLEKSMGEGVGWQPRDGSLGMDGKEERMETKLQGWVSKYVRVQVRRESRKSRCNLHRQWTSQSTFHE